jgi:hypothetical protein
VAEADVIEAKSKPIEAESKPNAWIHLILSGADSLDP